MTDLTLRRATAADDQVLAVLAARLSAFELPAWRAPHEIGDADSRAMIAAAASGNPDDEVLIAERGGEVVGCLHVMAVTDFFGPAIVSAHITSGSMCPVAMPVASRSSAEALPEGQDQTRRSAM